VRDDGNDQEHRLQRTEGGVIPRPEVLGLLPVVARLVHDLRPRGQQVPHLVQGGLDVHLLDVREAAQVLRRGAAAAAHS
jgi:hypothetical protein